MDDDNRAMFSPDAEAAVLGTILQTGGDGAGAAWWRVHDRLTVADFGRSDHRRIFGALARLAPAGLGHDALTVADLLEGAGGTVLEDAGGLPYLSDLAFNAAGANVETWAGIIRKYAERRRLAAIGAELTEAARAPDSEPLALVSDFATRLDAMHAQSTPAEVVTTWADDPPDPAPFLVPGWLPAERVTLFTGKGGAGKSRLALQLAMAMARGSREWMPCGGPRLDVNDPARVVLASWEDEPGMIAWRLHQIGDRAGVRELRDRLHVAYLAGCGPLWAKPDGARYEGHAQSTPAGAWLRSYAKRVEAALLVIDPLAAAYAANENDRGEVRAFMASWADWARETGCTVLMVAHPSKSTDEYSGSTDWQAAPRAVWTLAAENDDDKDRKKANKANKADDKAPLVSVLTCTKSSYAKRPNPVRMTGSTRWRVIDPKSTDDGRERARRMAGG